MNSGLKVQGTGAGVRMRSGNEEAKGLKNEQVVSGKGEPRGKDSLRSEFIGFKGSVIEQGDYKMPLGGEGAWLPLGNSD